MTEKCIECGAERRVDTHPKIHNGRPYRVIGGFNLAEVSAGKQPCKKCFAWLHEYGGLDAEDGEA